MIVGEIVSKGQLRNTEDDLLADINLIRAQLMTLMLNDDLQEKYSALRYIVDSLEEINTGVITLASNLEEKMNN